MRITFIQHVPFEDPAYLLTWAQLRGHAVSTVRVYDAPDWSIARDCDLLVVLGGPMGADDDNKFTWMVEEKRAIADTHAAGKGILGICLGAQLMARVFGAAVHKNQHREIGWFEVRRTPGSDDAILGALPATFSAFHWHGDTFDIPPGAIHTASSDGCANQAFEYDDRAVGLQFHLEATADSIMRLAAQCRDEMTPGPYVQTVEQILAQRDRIPHCNRLMDAVMERFEGRLREEIARPEDC